MIGLLCVVILLLSILYQFTRSSQEQRAKQRLLDKLPGPKSYPLIGSVLEYVLTPQSKRLEHIRSFTKKYGSVFKLLIGNKYLVCIREPEAAEIVLSSRSNVNKGFGYDFLDGWIGTGMVNLKGSDWLKRRKAIIPAFHSTLLETFFQIFLENTEIFINKLGDEIDSSEFDIFNYVNNCALDIICETAMGVKVNAQNYSSDYASSVKIMLESITYRTVRPWLWPDFIYRFSNNYKKEVAAKKILHEMSTKVIMERKQKRKEGAPICTYQRTDNKPEIKKRIFLDVLLDIVEQSNGELTDIDLRNETYAFIFAGHDTTSIGISWIIYLIGLHQDVQDKMYAELKQVLGSTTNLPTMDQISELKYMECVIKESLRLFTPAPCIGRTLGEDITIRNYEIPAGTFVQLELSEIHRDPNHWGADPERFNPDNFTPEKVQNRHPYAFIPFSGGPRNCIGQKYVMIELKVILAMLLSKYKMVSLEKLEDISITSELILRAEGGLNMQVFERE